MNYSIRGDVEGFQPLEIIYEHNTEYYALFVESSLDGTLKFGGESKKIHAGGTYNYSGQEFYVSKMNFFGYNNTKNNMVIMNYALRDHCLDQYLSEYYCKNDNEYGISVYDCKVGCVNGACLNQTA